ncbi:uncharacterized protein LOC117785189 [Drosophila innubila]|uniref:uncharacterized protein LOC117785189 n=1 Tax=Drosophila innubila TaxID=198719 RepID=UPI00148C933B|nr:uncharacterized protein LOC117785189 [Drosophila innubila]
MLLNKTYRHVAIGLIVMGLALVTFAYPYQLQGFLNVIQGLQGTATVALLFGILKKDPIHKDKFLLFWLVSTAVFFFSLFFCSFNYISNDFYAYYFFSSLMTLLAQWIATAAVGCFMYLMYQEYVELTENNRVAGLSLSTANVISPTFETKETPPPYIAPTSENLTVSIQS